MGVFQEYESQNYPYRYAGHLHLEDIAGGTPADPKVLEWHLRNKAGESATEQEISMLAAEIMAETGKAEHAALEDAVSKFIGQRGLTQFRRDMDRGLYIPGNNLKACIKEAGSIAVNAGRLKKLGWGTTNKGWQSWCAEHIFVIENKLFFGRDEADYTATSFPEVRTPSGPRRAIKYTEVCEGIDLDFTVECDVLLDMSTWGAIWSTAQRIGLGADRAHYGRFDTTRWDMIGLDQPRTNNKRRVKVAA